MDAIATSTSLRPPVKVEKAAPTATTSGNSLPESGKEQPPAEPPVDLAGAVKQIETYLSSSQRSLSFSLDESSGRPVMTVINPETGEVIRQVPGDEVLRMAAAVSSGGARLLNTLV